jgi:hypothetical protein
MVPIEIMVTAEYQRNSLTIMPSLICIILTMETHTLRCQSAGHGHPLRLRTAVAVPYLKVTAAKQLRSSRLDLGRKFHNLIASPAENLPKLHGSHVSWHRQRGVEIIEYPERGINAAFTD